MGVSKVIDPPHIVPVQLKNLIPVAPRSRSSAGEEREVDAPVTNMWWAQTDTDKTAIAIVAPTRPT